MSPDGQDLALLDAFLQCFKNVVFINEIFERLFLYFIFYFFMGAKPVFRFSHFWKTAGLSGQVASVDPFLERWENQSFTKNKNYCTSFFKFTNLKVMELLL